ncbi:hypothetical protein O6H91_14G010900 [Diphasiastrum complanatum]|uniref:Uncharacterized protein n=1 Tax=Diphasiastrum complanatum TaxID=34168 RepID=A0ACC2BM97_DIPCM|nr:hypothetical protein O6H91_14G010900 [Diphasiastrum complanatum]
MSSLSSSSSSKQHSSLHFRRPNFRSPIPYTTSGYGIQYGMYGPCKRFTCKAGLEDDAPYAIAMGACVLSTLVIPILKDSRNNTKSENITTFSPDDIRYAAMGIISFIPLFNWLAWIFAWLDTNEQQYLIYAIIYLAPYLKTGLSLSPDESWLPVASVLVCIVHVQLEIAVKSEGMEALQLKADLSKMLLEKSKMKELRVRADGLLNRLQHLAERTEVPRSKATKVAPFIEDDGVEKEFKEWDKQFLGANKKDERPFEESRVEEEK